MSTKYAALVTRTRHSNWKQLPLIVGLTWLMGSVVLQAQPPVIPLKPGAAPVDVTGTVKTKTRRDLYETGVAAKVNREVITSAEVWDKVRAAAAGLNADQRERLYIQTLANMIQDRAYDQAAGRLRLVINEKHIKAHVERQKEELGGDDAFQDFLVERGQTHEEYVTDIARSSQRHLYLRAFTGSDQALGDLVRPEFSVRPTVREVREYYEKNMEEEFSAVRRTEISYIAVPIAATATRNERGTPEKTKALALKIRDQLATGADFKVLAKKHSPVNADKGGYEGWHDEDSTLNPKILEYGLNGEIGKVSEPLEMRRGRMYVLVKVHDRKEARVVPFAEAQKAIFKKLEGARRARARAEAEERILREAYIWPVRYKQLLIEKVRSGR